jgi:branched-chain amino acid transport system ATP-binding protein
MSQPSLNVRELRAGYGQMEVVSGISLSVRPGELVALLGRNGAGKSTLLAAMAGMRTCWSQGIVLVDEEPMRRRTPVKVAKAGLALVPEGRRIFREMTVHENLLMGAYLHRRRPRADLATEIAKVTRLFPALETFSGKSAGAMSGGEQQMVAIGQALMSRPHYLLLDEPTSGLAPKLAEELYESMQAIAATGPGILVVEQSIDRALHYSDRIYVMDNGQIVLEGKSADLLGADAIDRIVLGSPSEASL